MYTVENKTTEIPMKDPELGTDKLLFSHLIRLALDTQPVGGWRSSVNRERDKIQKVIDDMKAKEYKFDTELFGQLKEIVAAAVWPTRHIGFSEFEDYIKAINADKEESSPAAIENGTGGKSVEAINA